MIPAMRNWLEKAIASGIDWKDSKRMTRNEFENFDFLGGENGEFYGPLAVSDILRINYIYFNNFRRRFLTKTAHLHPDWRQSLSKYAEMITHAVGISTLQDF